MNSGTEKILLISMPFAGTVIPSIQLAILESYIKELNVDITSKHLYLMSAGFYGLKNYNFLINRPGESYTAQMVYSKYVFPDHWKKNENLFKDYFNGILSKSKEFKQSFSFEEYVEKTDCFYNWVLDNINWKDYDLIGFSLNFGQLLPSLAIAKKIKELFPDKKIVFGGSRTVYDLGKRILKFFDYIDYIVSGDGEDALYYLATNY